MEFLLNGLNKFTKYTVAVRAFNRYGEGPLSEPVVAVTLEDGKPLFSYLLTLHAINLWKKNAPYKYSTREPRISIS